MPLPRAKTDTTEQADRNARFSALTAECREITMKWSTDAIAAGVRTALPTAAPWIGLGVSASVIRPMVRVHNAYAIRDALKAAGYHYDMMARCREYATVADAVAEARRLAAAVGIQLGDGAAAQ